MLRRNKIKTGWDAVSKKNKNYEKSKVPWTARYEIKHVNEDNIISKIIKFIIRVSLFFAFDRKDVTKSKTNLMINNTYNILSSNQFKFIPSSVAFYLMLSFIPIFVIVVSIISALNENWYGYLINEIFYHLIPGMQNMFSKVDFDTGEILFIVFFMISSIWFASKGINKFRDSFTQLYGFEDKQNFIIKRLKSIFIVVMISIYFSITTVAFTPLMILIKKNINNNVLYEVIFYLFSFIYILFFGYIGIGLLYKYISPIKLKWSYLNLGILTSLIPIVIFLLLFSTICKFLNYEKFGTIGTFIYLVLFILYISYFLHAGIIINSSYYKTNVFKNVVARQSMVGKKIQNVMRNSWLKIKNTFNR